MERDGPDAGISIGAIDRCELLERPFIRFAPDPPKVRFSKVTARFHDAFHRQGNRRLLDLDADGCGGIEGLLLGLGQEIRDTIGPIGRVDLAFRYGSCSGRILLWASRIRPTR